MTDVSNPSNTRPIGRWPLLVIAAFAVVLLLFTKDAPVSWADAERDVSAWLGNPMQHEAHRQLYSLRERIYAERGAATQHVQDLAKQG